MVTVELVCPPGNYQKVTNIGLYDRKGNVVGGVGTLECGAGNLSTYPGTGEPSRASRTVQVTSLPSRSATRASGSAPTRHAPRAAHLGGPVYITFGPTLLLVEPKSPPTTIPCQALDSNGQGYASSLRVSW